MEFVQTALVQKRISLGVLGSLWRIVFAMSSPSRHPDFTPSQLRRVEVIEEIRSASAAQNPREWREALLAEFNTTVHALHATQKRHDERASDDMLERLRAISSALKTSHQPSR